MKTLVIILNVLIALEVVYGDINAVKQYKQAYEKCAQKIKAPVDQLRIDTLICVAIEDGGVLDKYGGYIVEECAKRLHTLITHPDRLKKATELFNKCDKKATETGAKGFAKLIEFLICGAHIVTYFDLE
ncbi:uncharacterized protein LOC116853094 [Odontomachus brunneus]|uniref:uncharacterized protein LOC116853094 n=1 Tax=Odontomachus brunneus TaxID=486640 RepID=UPI0013F19ECD|nr:uncharacterized protein LOC116853094 [Odontomachus brunneus]